MQDPAQKTQPARRGRRGRPVAEEGNRRVAHHIRRYRRLAGLTLGAVGEALGISYQAVSHMELGQNQVAASQLAVLARLYGAPIDAFFAPIEGVDAGIQFGTSRIEELMEAFSRIDSHDAQRTLLALARALAQEPQR
jgi:transcriptional regulator with XRE-family HTH domain